LLQIDNSSRTPESIASDSVGDSAIVETEQSSTPKSTEAPNYFHVLSEADRAERNGDYAHAEELYVNLLARFPNDADTYVRLGTVRREAGDHDGAMSAYTKALQIDKNNGSAWGGIGHVFLANGGLVEAAAAWEKAAELLPERDDYSTMLIMLYVRLELWDRAVVYAEREANRYRASVMAKTTEGFKKSSLSTLATVYMGAKRWKDAEAVYQELLALAPEDEGAMIGLGQLAIRRGDYSVAKQFLEPLGDQNAEGLYERARIAALENDFFIAADLLHRSLRLDATHADRWALLGAIEHDRDRLSASLDAIEQAVRLEPETAAHRAIRARVLLRLKKYKEALNEADRAKSLGDSGWEVMELRGQALLGLEMKADAEEAFQGVLQVHASPVSAISLAELLEAREAWLQAAELYEALEQMDAEDADTWREERAKMHIHEALSLSAQDDLEGAIDQSKQSVEVTILSDRANVSVLVMFLKTKALTFMNSRDWNSARQVVAEISKYDKGEAANLRSLMGDH